MKKIKIIAEIGINFNNDINKAKRLIDVASIAKADYVKFQKRTPEKCVPETMWDKEKKVPWRKESTTYLQYKKDMELSSDCYKELKEYCKTKNIQMFSSAWDCNSVNFLSQYDAISKIPSAKLTDWNLLYALNQKFNNTILSTGMSTEKEIEKAVEILKPSIIMHTNSTYPTPKEDLNLEYIIWLKNKYPKLEIGYSSHFYGILDVFIAIGLGATWIEKHICESHDDWGSDQKSSVEPHGFIKMCKSIRELELSLKGNNNRQLLPGELEKLKQLR